MNQKLIASFPLYLHRKQRKRLRKIIKNDRKHKNIFSSG